MCWNTLKCLWRRGLGESAGSSVGIVRSMSGGSFLADIAECSFFYAFLCDLEIRESEVGKSKM